MVTAPRGAYSDREVEARLGEAGRVLLGLPWAGCFPGGFRCPWPDAQPTIAHRRRTPTSHQIDAMDEAYAWVALVLDVDERRLVLMRSLMLPPSRTGRERHVWTWGRLRRATGLHPDTLKKRHDRGIGRITFGLNHPVAPAESVRRSPRPMVFAAD